MTMMRACLTMLFTTCLAASACADLDVQETSQPVIGDDCDYITCGRNTRDVGNGIVDQVYFDHTPNDRGQQFVSWHLAGQPITPFLWGRTLLGVIDGQVYVGTGLVGSVMSLVASNGQPLSLYLADARAVQLPNGVTTWTYRIDVWLPTSQRPLCNLFSHTNDEIARYALLGTSEVVHVSPKHVTAHSPSEGKLTLGCPNSATGKLLSLGALTTTATSSEAPTLNEMTAALLALTLSPTGGASYTQNGIGVMFSVTRTGVDNNGESISGGVEGRWDASGAVCFEHLRLADEDRRRAIWTETHVPPCSAVDLSQHQILVHTNLYSGVYPAYPPPPAAQIILP